RFVFWDSPSAPDLRLRGGYGFFQFPLPARSFPGMRVLAPYAGAAITLPIVPEFAFYLAGSYSPQLTVEGRAKQLGTIESAVSFDAEGGVRLVFEPFQVGLVARIKQYDIKYKG